ncbi:MAG: hypothetical protein ACTSRG_16660 [Candidatus Helarchaeota archaeon]
MISEIGHVTLLTWIGNYEIDEVKILIDPGVNGMFIDEQLLKDKLKDISELNYLFDSQFEVSIELFISDKVPPHSFYVLIMPTKDFPDKYRKEGIGIILGKPWIELTQYPLKNE